MRNKVYWGLGVLIVLLIGAFVLVMVNEYAENDQLESDAKKAQEQADRNKQQKTSDKNPNKILVAQEDVKVNDEPKQLPVAETESSDYEFTEAEHEVIKKLLPIEYESNLELRESLEKLHKAVLVNYQRHPDYEPYRRDMASVQEQLDATNRLLTGLEKAMEEYEYENK